MVSPQQLCFAGLSPGEQLVELSVDYMDITDCYIGTEGVEQLPAGALYENSTENLYETLDLV